MIKAVIFDLDNTLMDFMKMKSMSIDAAINGMIEAGLNLKFNSAKEHIYKIYEKKGYEYQEVFDDFLIDIHGKLDYKILASAIVAYRKTKEASIILYPNVNSTLIKLAKRGYKLAVLSDAPSREAWVRLYSVNLHHIFDVVVTYNDTEKLKPSPEPFNRAVELLKIHPENIIMVGDYGHGIITEKIRKLILKRNYKVFLNTQINSFNRGYHTVFKYKKVETLVINESELRYELRDKHSAIPELVKILFKKISVKNIIVTKGIYGSVLINKKNNLIISCPAFDQNNIDTVGAGDTLFAICSIAIGSKVDKKISMMMGAISAGFATNQIGNKFYYNFQTLKKHLTHIFK